MTTRGKLPPPKTLKRPGTRMARKSAIKAEVDDYVKYTLPCRKREFDEWYELTDEVAVERAGLGLLPDGSAKHPHQYRVPRAALRESCDALLPKLSEIQKFTSFDDLFELVEETISEIRGIGEVTIYDTAVRIGARFDLEPEKVYVHAGTRVGARALDLAVSQHVIEMDDLPEPIRRLSGREAEDFLCTHKKELAAIA